MNNKTVVFSNLIWRFLERTGAQLVSFIVSIVLARILLPEEYGVVAIATIVISFLNVFIDNGLGNALIQKKECDSKDYSTAFWANVVICGILYVLLFVFVAPLIAALYKQEVLKNVLRVMGISIIISSLKNVQQAYVSRQLKFKLFFWATSAGTIISAVIGIIMAYTGFGVWALVVQYLSNACIDTLFLFIVVEWKPSLFFSLERFKQLISYGYKLLISSLINCTYDNLRQLLIGKMYSSSDLAFYNRGKQFPSMVMTNINTSIDSVLFPVLSKEQDNEKKLRSMAKQSLTTSSFLLFPVLIGLASISNHLIPLILTEKWNSSIVFVQIFCLFYSFHPMQTTNLNIIKATGNSSLYLKMELIQTIVGVSLLVPVIFKGPIYIAAMYLITAIFNATYIGGVSGKLIGYSVIQQYKDMLPYYFMTFIMGIMVLLVGRITQSHWIVLLQIAIGAAVYVVLCLLIKPTSYIYILDVVKEKRKND